MAENDTDLAEKLLDMTNEERVEMANQLGEFETQMNQMLIAAANGEEVDTKLDLEPEVISLIGQAIEIPSDYEETTTEVDGVDHGSATDF